MPIDEIPEAEHAFREEALAYLVSRYERASQALQDRQYDAFRDFVALWLEAVDWRTEEGVRRWLQIPEPQRAERMERFRRQAASWDVSLEFHHQDDRRAEEERARKKREQERTKRRLREEQDAAAWEQVREMLESEHRQRAMPSWLRGSYDFLGLPARATLADARRRYRELAKKYHPDTTGSTELMAKLNDAWANVEAFFSGRTDSVR
jgi:hypothetical protein